MILDISPPDSDFESGEEEIDEKPNMGIEVKHSKFVSPIKHRGTLYPQEKPTMAKWDIGGV